jgi:squalene-associated FAD-dependent desaturase
MKHCIVVGGGFAGLSASVYLADEDLKITLLEASPKLGGRAYSLFNKENNSYYDNGQHILMGCYDETIAFLRKINSINKLDFQESLSISFVQRGGKINKLFAPKILFPLNLLFAIMNYKVLRFRDRLKIVDVFLDLLCDYSDNLKTKTVKEWLDSKNQSENNNKAFWDIIIAGALNTTSEKASAELFSEILKQIFLTDNASSVIIIPDMGMSDLYIDNAVNFISTRKGIINLNEKVIAVLTENDKIVKIETNKNIYEDFDFLVIAIPTYAIEKIDFLNSIKPNIPKLNYSPILNVHFWLNVNPFKEKFYGLIDSKIHWLFNHGNHISMTASSADELIGFENDDIKTIFLSEIEKFFPIFKSEFVSGSKIIKEKRATFIPDIASNKIRKDICLPYDNLFLAGDWVNTGLPSTIESAVLSGRLAANYVLSSLNN